MCEIGEMGQFLIANGDWDRARRDGLRPASSAVCILSMLEATQKSSTNRRKNLSTYKDLVLKKAFVSG